MISPNGKRFTTISDNGVMTSHDVGVDGNKKVKGRKRMMMTDGIGLLVAVVVTAANTSDSEGLRLLLQKVKSLGLNLERSY